MRGYRLEKAKTVGKRFLRSWLRELSTSSRNSFTADDIQKIIGVARKTRCRCSCWMCRNLRELEGITLNERKQLIDKESEGKRDVF
jgi:hypothetical protein